MSALTYDKKPWEKKMWNINEKRYVKICIFYGETLNVFYMNYLSDKWTYNN